MRTTTDPGMVLVVDDDLDLVDAMEMVLQMGKCRVTRAPSGKCALEALGKVAVGEAERPCLVLLDLMLPDIRGEEVYRNMQELPAVGGAIPVVVMSAMVDGAVRARSLGLPFLPKPFEIDDLLRVVQRHCRGDLVPPET